MAAIKEPTIKIGQSTLNPFRPEAFICDSGGVVWQTGGQYLTNLGSLNQFVYMVESGQYKFVNLIPENIEKARKL